VVVELHGVCKAYNTGTAIETEVLNIIGLLDRAVLAHVDMPAELRLTEAYRKVDEIPFDFERRRMSVVVAVAVKTLPPGQTAYSVADETGLTLIGYIAFLDPPKESAAPALRALAAHGIAVKVMTGDNELVTAQVCRQVGLPADALLSGAQIEAMDEPALQAAAQSHQVFVKLTPLHKERIVRALRAAGHVVGFMGDGINDAPALRAADIGRFMLFFGPISSLFDIVTFVVMWQVFAANTVARQTLFQSGWFVVGLLTQTLVVHMVRTPKLPFVQSRAAAPLMAMTLAIVAIGLWLPVGPLAGYFKLQALPDLYYVWLHGIVVGFCTLITLMKRIYIRRYGWQ